ncbi:SET domain-containing protein [Xylariaceae sp. FL0016]|nr:SET domain-containing protein [Xylariaceae sp. FL0016]
MQEILPLSLPRALSSEMSDSAPADTFDHVASLSSTPPTTTADTMSLASDFSKQDPTHNHASVDDEADPMNVDEPQDLAADSIVIATTTETTTTTATLAAPIESTESLKYTRKSKTASAASTPTIERSRRQRITAPIYNLAKLAGTAIHGKRRSKGDDVADRKRRTVSSDTLIGTPEGENAKSSESLVLDKEAVRRATDKINASIFRTSSRDSQAPKAKLAKKQDVPPRRISTRASGLQPETLAEKVSSLGKRGRKTFEKGISKMTREMRRLQDTNEFAGVDTKPVLYTTWANGKYVDPYEQVDDSEEEEEEERPRKKTKVAEVAEEEEMPAEVVITKQRRTKKWLDRGLYAGQEAPVDIYKGLTANEKKKLAQLPELMPSAKVNKTLPQPMFGGLRKLIAGSDFRLPFDVCNPLPPGQPKPDEWRKMTKNRFVGDAGAYWKKTPHFKDYQSKCVCTPEDGCTESCQNRIMLYECDHTNCNVGIEYCENRAFARLTERTKAGGKFRVGVEVFKTEDRGYGIRANRPFQANQIIMEYTGEIITEEECDRRMNEKYKDNECYYLMSFDQNMIIDATTGSIARFVNHSCSPNSRMVKWIVSGQPRMALFAGDRDIMTGEELTYDYKFDPFSAKNVQKCLCGSPNCRGVLGPKPKEVKPPKPSKDDSAKVAVKKVVKTAKRKLKEVLGDEDDNDVGAAKKRKIKTPAGVKAKTVKAKSVKATSVKRSLSGSSLKAAQAAKGTAKVVKRSVSTISVNTKATLGSKSAGRKIAAVKKSKSVVKTYSKAKAPLKKTQSKLSMSKKATPKKSASRKQSLPVADAGEQSPGVSTKATPLKLGTPKKSSVGSPSPRKAVDLPRPKIRLVNSPTA